MIHIILCCTVTTCRQPRGVQAGLRASGHVFMGMAIPGTPLETVHAQNGLLNRVILDFSDTDTVRSSGAGG
jgi:hypothetical protein